MTDKADDTDDVERETVVCETPKLPTEIWVKILSSITCPKKISTIRRVSSYYRELIDEHRIFSVVIKGPDFLKIPGHHVRIHELELIDTADLLEELSPIGSQVELLKKLKVVRDYNPINLGAIFRDAKILEEIEIDLGSVVQKINNLNGEFYQMTSPKINSIGIYDSTQAYHGGDPQTRLNQHIAHEIRFICLVNSILQIPTIIPPPKNSPKPSVTELYLEYAHLSFESIDRLVKYNILPFLRRNCMVLKSVTIDLLTWTSAQQKQIVRQERKFDLHPPQSVLSNDADKDNPSHQSHVNDIVNDNEDDDDTAMTCLNKLALRLPDVLLNRVLTGIYKCTSNMPNNLMEELILEWRQPYSYGQTGKKKNKKLKKKKKNIKKNNNDGQNCENKVKDDEDDDCNNPAKIIEKNAINILHHILVRNRESLLMIDLESFNTNVYELLAPVKETGPGFKIRQFPNLKELTVGGRTNSDEDTNERDSSLAICQNAVFSNGSFPVLKFIHVHDIKLTLWKLRDTLMSCSSSLINVNITNNLYENGLKVDCSFVVDLAEKMGMREVVIGPKDLCASYRYSNHFDDFKRLNLQVKEFDSITGLFFKVH